MHRRLLLALIVVAAVLAASGCSQSPRGAAPAATPTPPPRTGEVRIEAGDAVVRAELALTQEEKARGLMFRDSLPEGRGMLFPFDRPGTHAFWMKNVKFPIDMLWLDSGLTVVYRETSVPPCPLEPCAIYRPDRPASYVLEVPSGFSEAHNITVGSGLRLLDPLPSPLSG